MKIDILVGDNDYATEVHFAKALGSALKSLGFSIRLHWVGEGHFFHALYEMINDPPDWSCSFSDISLNQTPLGSLWTIPHVSLLADPPIYFLHQLSATNGWVSCVDENDLAFVQALQFKRAIFLPHAADCAYKTPVLKERPFDAVFFGSCIDYEEVAEKWHNHEKELLHYASELVLSDRGLSIAQALVELKVKEEDFARLHDEVDRYTRGLDRILQIGSIKDRPVHIWGKGPWKKFFPEHAVHPPIDFNECLKVMQSSRLVLNSSPRFKAGAHERIFYALMCGCAVYTGENRFLKSELPQLYTYTYGSWQAPHFTDWQEHAEGGQAKVLESHNWQVRAKTLAELFLEKNR